MENKRMKLGYIFGLLIFFCALGMFKPVGGNTIYASLGPNGETVIKSGYWTYYMNNGFAYLNGYDGPKEVKIPLYIDDESVICVTEEAFAKCKDITSVTLTTTKEPLTYLTINDHTFEDCTQLKSVQFTDYISSIGSYAFAGCTALESINIPYTVMYAGTNVFENCTSLKSVVWSINIKNILEDTFSGCSSLEKIKNIWKVETIADRAFQNTALTDFEFGNTLNSIGERAFAYCKNLQSANIPDQVTHIGPELFLNARV